MTRIFSSFKIECGSPSLIVVNSFSELLECRKLYFISSQSVKISLEYKLKILLRINYMEVFDGLKIYDHDAKIDLAI